MLLGGCHIFDQHSLQAVADRTASLTLQLKVSEVLDSPTVSFLHDDILVYLRCVLKACMHLQRDRGLARNLVMVQSPGAF